MSEIELGIISKKRSPLIAIVLSLIMPGLGHIYCGRITKGITLAFLSCIFIPLLFGILSASHFSIRIAVIITSLFALLVVWLIAIVDSWRTAKHTSESYTLKDYNKRYVYLILVLMSTGSSIPIAHYVRANFFEAFRVPTAAGYPTIVPGDRFLANKLAYQNNDPKKGDIVVFISPEDRRVKYVKRVVAIAGETVEIKNNDLYINGQKLERKKIDDSILSKIKIEVQGKMLDGDIYEETNNGAKYKIFLTSGADLKSADFAVVTVPQYHCFVLGDNRNSSEDSRHYSSVPLVTIKGRADYLYWPAKDWSRFGSLKTD